VIKLQKPVTGIMTDVKS